MIAVAVERGRVHPAADQPVPAGLARNALGMLSGRVASMALGFVFWLLAARMAAAGEVGLTSAVVAAMMLATQLAQLGIGSAFIAAYPEHRQSPRDLLDSAVTLSVVGALATAALLLLAAGASLSELGRVATQASWVLLFLAMAVLGTVNVVFDHVSMAMGRGHQVLTRNVLFGGTSVLALGALGAADVRITALELFSVWVLSGVAACALGLDQLRRCAGRYTFRARLVPSLARRLVGVGLANHALTLCERAPGLVLPIVVTEVLSPETNAYWYVVWMAAWVVFIAPVSVGVALFAEGARHPGDLAVSTSRALRTSVGFGVLGGLLLGALAHPVLSMLGPRYAAEGVTPLRVLLVAVVPLALITAYYAQCRARARWREALTTGALSAVVGVVAAAAAGERHGLLGMAVTWVVVQSLTATWAASRLWRAR